MFPSTGSPLRPALPSSPTSSCVAALLLPLLCWLRPSSSAALACPRGCLCASDIISCSGAGLSRWPRDVPAWAAHLDLSHNLLATLPANWSAPRTLRRLASLLLARNAIAGVEPDAFALTPHLVHLDLSSNRLAAVRASAFGRGALPGLEVLLLFGNRIAAVEPGALSGLRGLRRLYLAGNRLAAVPLELLEGRPRPAHLALLDLSSNALTALPVQSLLALGARPQVYLQGNPLVCDCALRALLGFWCRRRYRPLLDFRAEYPCGAGGGGGCSTSTTSTANTQDLVSPVGGVYQIEPGDWLTVPCPGLAPPLRENQTVFWLTPGAVLNSSSSSSSGDGDGGDHGNATLRRVRVLPSGALEIRGAVAADAGTYTCVAARGAPPEPECGGEEERGGADGEVSVLVGNKSQGGGGARGGGRRRGAEHFNTAFTTLASCVVSIVLVLLYLYLTPCRCRGDRGRGGGGGSGEATTGCGGRASLLCSDPGEAESRERRSHNGKRVAFLEPRGAEEDGDKGVAGAAGGCDPGITVGTATGLVVGMATESILKNGGGAIGGRNHSNPGQQVV
ncbi:amphoterin-induced protein 2-like [Gadus chalcogrammus]|uniref:amphoterin-induced protein 2-like n=1 Tax=Gadus chalcogrammus TaxID=1042646 RepID=UPI0024C21195|nr:amphoterin-induced protein 2-like [Gadus chalcogrammus]